MVETKHLEAKNRRNNLFLVGLSATGKTTIGKIIAKMLDYEFVDSDAEIEARTGVQVSWIFELEGESKFRERESEVLKEITRRNRIVLATGGGIVLREENRGLLRSRGWVVCLTSNTEELARRAGNVQTRPLLQKGESLEETFVQMDRERRPLYESVSDVTFKTFGEDKRTLARDIVAWYRKIDS